MKEVFADSFYYLALLNKFDAHHPNARALTETLQLPVITTHWVLLEVADGLSAPRARQRAAGFLRDIAVDRATTVITDIKKWYSAGLQLYAARLDKSWSLTDCISFAVMEALGIHEALTGDHHFEQAGFVCLMRKPS